MLALLSLSLPLFLATAAGAPPKAEINEALAAFSSAVSAGDADSVARYLHPDAVQHIQLPTGAMTLDTEGYLGLVREGKVGGEPIELEVHDVHVTGTVATASTVRLSGPYRLTDAVSLAKGEAGWQIVAMAVSATPR